MTTSIKTLVHKSGRNMLHLILLGALTASTPFLIADDSAGNDAKQSHAAHDSASPPKLVEAVRNATRQFIDVNAATAANYGPLFGCVTGPDHGAMGVHYVNATLVGDNEINEAHPEALIYEPTADGLKLVGVEYIVDASNWMALHNSPPVLEGQVFQYVSAPNRFGLPAFFELHVWAWRDNPNGAFVDWNTRVTCEGQ